MQITKLKVLYRTKLAISCGNKILAAHKKRNIKHCFNIAIFAPTLPRSWICISFINYNDKPFGAKQYEGYGLLLITFNDLPLGNQNEICVLHFVCVSSLYFEILH